MAIRRDTRNSVANCLLMRLIRELPICAALDGRRCDRPGINGHAMVPVTSRRWPTCNSDLASLKRSIR